MATKDGMELDVHEGCNCRWKEVMPGMWARTPASGVMPCPVHDAYSK